MPIVVSGRVMGVGIKDAVLATTDRPAQERRCEVDVYIGPKQMETILAPIDGLAQLKTLDGKEEDFPCKLSVWHMNGKTGKTWTLVTI